MLRILPFVTLLTLVLVPSHPVLGQGFQGVIRQRTLAIDEAAIQDLLFGDADEEDVPDETEEAYIRRMATRLFDVPLGRVLAAAREGGEVEETTIYVKGSRIRTGVEGAAETPFGWMVVDLDAGTFTIISEQERYFVRVTHDELGSALQAMGAPSGGDDPEGVAPELRALTNTVVVAGKRCRGFETMLDEGEFARGWVSDAYPTLQQALRNYGQQAAALFGDEEDEGPSIEDLLSAHGFPMLVQRVHGGFGTFSSYDVEEVLSVEQKPVPDATFDVPAGFTQKSLKELWGQ